MYCMRDSYPDTDRIQRKRNNAVAALRTHQVFFINKKTDRVLYSEIISVIIIFAALTNTVVEIEIIRLTRLNPQGYLFFSTTVFTIQNNVCGSVVGKRERNLRSSQSAMNNNIIR